MLGSPRLRLFLGAALISLSPVWVRLVDVSPTTSGFYRAAIGGIALTAYLAASGQRLQLTRWMWRMLMVAAVFFSLDLWFWHRSINYIGPGLSTLLANFQVFIMMGAGALLLKQRPSAQQLIAVPLALVGLGLIVGVDWSALSTNYQLGVVFGLLTAVAYAGYLLTMRAVRANSVHRVPSREIAVMSVAVALMLGVSAMVEGESLAIPTLTDAGWLLGYGLLSHSLGMMLIASSLPQVSTTEAGLALLLQPTLSFVWDVVIFDRPMTVAELAGAAIALFAIYLGARPSKQA
ncbi:MAG: DMT family transporter [Woeseiaceae bacterium]|nr:DMT family transporter [Woeseiaceae bacterium]